MVGVYQKRMVVTLYVLVLCTLVLRLAETEYEIHYGEKGCVPQLCPHQHTVCTTDQSEAIDWHFTFHSRYFSKICGFFQRVLNERNYSVWIDTAGIRAGQKWKTEIAHGIHVNLFLCECTLCGRDQFSSSRTADSFCLSWHRGLPPPSTAMMRYHQGRTVTPISLLLYNHFTAALTGRGIQETNCYNPVSAHRGDGPGSQAHNPKKTGH